jgi:hypothetical protein
VSSISPTSGYQGTVVTISGSGFGSFNTTASVLIGNAPCVVNALQYRSNRIVCTVGATPAGSSTVYVTLPGLGTARSTTQFNSLLVVSSFTPSSGSFGGGETVQVYGQGFGSGASGSIVYICGQQCVVQSSSYNTLQCLTSQVATAESLTAFNSYDAIVVPGTPGTPGNSAGSAFDKDYLTFTNNCASYDVGPKNLVVLTAINFFPFTAKYQAIVNGYFQVSVDGTTWTTVAVITTPGGGGTHCPSPTPSPCGMPGTPTPSAVWWWWSWSLWATICR